MSEISENIKRLRAENHMTLDELAVKVGTTKQTVYKYENDIIKDVPYKKIMAFASALGVTPPELMGITPHKEADDMASANRIMTYYEGIKNFEKDRKTLKSDDEIRLIKVYRSLSPENKIALLESAIDLMEEGE